MTSQQILYADVLDILFEGRNKLYGAYQLRKTYPRQLTKAVTIAVSTAFLLLFFIRPSVAGSVAVTDRGKEVVFEKFIPPKEEKKAGPPKAIESSMAQRVRQQLFTSRITITPKETESPVPLQDLFENTAISNITSSGEDAAIFQPQAHTETGTDRENKKSTEQEKEVVPDQQPQFAGGMQTWLAFLGQNLQSPQDLEAGEKRTVIIRFHVAEDGSVTNF